MILGISRRETEPKITGSGGDGVSGQQPSSGLGRPVAGKVVCGNPEGIWIGPVSVDRHHSLDQIEGGGAASQRSFEVGNVLASVLDLALRIIVDCLRMPVASDDLVRAEAVRPHRARVSSWPLTPAWTP